MGSPRNNYCLDLAEVSIKSLQGKQLTKKVNLDDFKNEKRVGNSSENT